jgi:pimeloyl-ACP methyl ester carboxylesterase
VGEHDQPLADQAPALADEVANGRLTVVPGAYHSPQLTHATQWRAAMEGHLSWAATQRSAP